MGNGRRKHFTCARGYANEVREGHVDVLRAGREEQVEERKAGHVRKQREARRLNDAAERRSVSNAGSVSVVRARIDRSAKPEGQIEGRAMHKWVRRDRE